jgi:hypothetical protein
MTTGISPSTIKSSAALAPIQAAFNTTLLPSTSTLMAREPSTIIKNAVPLEKQFAKEAAKRAEQTLSGKILKLALPLAKFTKLIPGLGAIITVVSELADSPSTAIEPNMRNQPTKFIPPKPLIGTNVEKPAIGETGGIKKLTIPNNTAKAPSSKANIGTQLEQLRKSVPTHIFKQETVEEEHKRTGRSIEEIIAERTSNSRVRGYQDHMNEIRDGKIKDLAKAIKSATASDVVNWYNNLTPSQRYDLQKEKSIAREINQKIDALKRAKTIKEILKTDPVEAIATYSRLTTAQKAAMHPDIRAAYEAKPAQRVYLLSQATARAEFDALTSTQRGKLPLEVMHAYFEKISYNLSRFTSRPMPKEWGLPSGWTNNYPHPYDNGTLPNNRTHPYQVR